MYYNIELINEKTKETILYEDVQDLNEGEKMYFNFQINAQELKDGEYKLNVIDGNGNVVASDTLNVGEFDIVGIQHKRGENVYINTVLDAKTEANDVEIREINSIVFPSGDADAMTSVFVRARPVFNDGYTEGYDNGHTDGYNSGKTDGFEEGKTEGYKEGKTDGITEGIESQKNKLTPIEITENGTYSNENGYNEVTVNVQDTNGSYDDGYNDGIASAENTIAENAQVLDITANGKYATKYSGGEGNLIKEVNVSVPKGGGGCVDFEQICYDENDVTKFNDDIAYSKTLYDAWNPERISADYAYQDDTNLVYCPKIDTSNVIRMERMFWHCSSLTTIPQLDTSKVTQMSSMFDGCSSLISIPVLDTSKVKEMYSMFGYCSSLKTIPKFDTSNVTSMESMFTQCKALITIPQLITSNVTNMRHMFYGCDSLTTIPQLDASSIKDIDYMFGYSNMTKITDLGGFKNLKVDWNSNYGLNRLPNLTYQSIMSIINNLYDFRGNGDTTTTRTLKIHSNAMAMLTDDDKAIAVNKGWTLTS